MSKPLVRRIEGINGGHHYVDQYDRKISGVTTILQCLPKELLQTWRLRKAVDLALKGEGSWTGCPEGGNPTTWLISAGDREADKKAKIGTGAHDFAEKYLFGDNPDIDNLSSKERYHAECFLQFIRDFEPEPILIEKVVTHIDLKGRPLYAGTLDLVAKLNDGMDWLIDWKASSSQPRASHALQAAAYSHATHWIDLESGELIPMVHCDRAAVVLLNGGGSENRGYRAIELDISDVVFSVFKSLLRIHNFSTVEDRVILGALGEIR